MQRGNSRKQNRRMSVMKKKATAAMTALAVMVVPMTAFAGDFEDFYDYQAENGKYVYYFENGIKLEMPEDWYQNVTVEAEESYVTFYHKDSYEKYKKDGYDAGGELLKIGCSVNTDFKDNPGYEYIGFDEEEALNFYYSTPTDYQAYTKDTDVKAEFDQLLGELDEVCDSITLTAKPDDEFYEQMEDSAEAARIAKNAAEGKKEDKGGTIAGKIGGDSQENSKEADNAVEEYTFDESKAEYEGTWVSFEDEFQIYLPSYWDYYNLTDEETEQGILYKAECESEDVSLIVNYALIDKTKLDSDAIAESYREAGYSDVKQMKINGILCETCTVPEEEISLTSFIGENDDRLYMIMLNTDDEGSLHYMDSILRSVKPAEK